MINAAQIREMVIAYLSGDLDRNDFLDGFALLSHNIHKCNDAEAVKFANLVETEIAAVCSGCISYDELRSTLKLLAG